MNLRTSIVVAACAAALAAAPAWAQFKPTKPVELIVHTGPGGGADVLARFMAQVIEKENLAPVRFQVNNKSGGGG
ncbi:MAG: tripartite tricarboxylate transporter substrate binding protein, partial [Burkholderiales bacterium]